MHSRPGSASQPQSLSSWAGEVCEASAQGGDAALTVACVAGVPGQAKVPLRGQRGSAVLEPLSTDGVRGPCVRAGPVLPHLQKRRCMRKGPWARRDDARVPPALSMDAGREARWDAGRIKNRMQDGTLVSFGICIHALALESLPSGPRGNPQELGLQYGLPSLIGNISPMF